MTQLPRRSASPDSPSCLERDRPEAPSAAKRRRAHDGPVRRHVLSRRALASSALAAAIMTFWNRTAVSSDDPRSAASTLGPAELLELGEDALARGEVAKAADAFERTAAMQHAAAPEMGLIRAHMQAGAYRRALAFAAHTAGAHRDVPAGAVLYAWLLHVGGQARLAQKMLDDVEARSPGDTLVAEARAQLRSGAPVATRALLKAPWRVAPCDPGVALLPTAMVVCSGVLLPGGRGALAPLTPLDDGHALWVRDGLGRKRAARIERGIDDLGLALLQLDDSIGAGAGLDFATRDAFPGAAAHAVGYVATPGATPAWPLLHVGFLGMPRDSTGYLKLGIDIGATTRGGPVFNTSGEFVGIALGGADGQDSLLPVSAVVREVGATLSPIANHVPGQRAAPDGIYERALQVTLQVIAAS